MPTEKTDSVWNPSLSKFIANFRDGARPNRFMVGFDIPQGMMSESSAAFMNSVSRFMVKSVNLPGRSFGAVEVKHLGETLKLIGDPVYPDLNITFLNSYDWKLRTALEEWFETLHRFKENKQAFAQDYLNAKIIIYQLGRKQGEILATYTYYNVVPMTLGDIELSHESRDVIEEFPMQISYTNWDRK